MPESPERWAEFQSLDQDGRAAFLVALSRAERAEFRAYYQADRRARKDAADAEVDAAYRADYAQSRALLRLTPLLGRTPSRTPRTRTARPRGAGRPGLRVVRGSRAAPDDPDLDAGLVKAVGLTARRKQIVKSQKTRCSAPGRCERG